MVAICSIDCVVTKQQTCDCRQPRLSSMFWRRETRWSAARSLDESSASRYVRGVNTLRQCALSPACLSATFFLHAQPVSPSEANQSLYLMCSFAYCPADLHVNQCGARSGQAGCRFLRLLPLREETTQAQAPPIPEANPIAAEHPRPAQHQ